MYPGKQRVRITEKVTAITFKKFWTHYNTEAVCRAELFRHWFPEDFVCPVYSKRGDKPKIEVTLSKTNNSAALYAGVKVIDNLQGQTLQQIVDLYFALDTKIECDDRRSYLNLKGVELTPKRYEVSDLHWFHNAIRNLKTILLGTYQALAGRALLPIDQRPGLSVLNPGYRYLYRVLS